MIKLLRFTFLISFFSLLISCASENETPVVVLSAEKNITAFAIPNIQTTIDQTNNKITVLVPAASNLDFDITVSISENAKLNYEQKLHLALSNDTEFIVTAADGSQKKYKIEIVREEGIKSFYIKLTDLLFSDNYAKIDLANKTITVDLPKNTLRDFKGTKEAIVFETTPGSTANIQSGSTFDHNNPGNLIITKSNGTVESYQIIVRNSEGNLSSFIFPSTFVTSEILLLGYSAYQFPATITAGLGNSDLLVRTLETENLSSIVPKKINISINATISPDLNAPQNFNQDVSYTVTSESGNKKTTKIRVIKEKIIVEGEQPTSYNYSKGGTFFRYVAISKVASIKFINEDTSEVVSATIVEHVDYANNDENYISCSLPTSATNGKYVMQVTLENGNVVNTYYKISLEK